MESMGCFCAASQGGFQETFPYFLRTLPPDTGQASAVWNLILEFQVPSATCVHLSRSVTLDFFHSNLGEKWS